MFYWPSPDWDRAAGLWPSADSPLNLLALIHAALRNMFYLEFYTLDRFVFILDGCDAEMLPLTETKLIVNSIRLFNQKCIEMQIRAVEPVS